MVTVIRRFPTVNLKLIQRVSSVRFYKSPHIITRFDPIISSLVECSRFQLCKIKFRIKFSFVPQR